MVDFVVSVVLPAAGIGSRIGGETPKQYIKILDRPLISYTIEAFERISWIKTIVVVGPAVESQKQILKNIIQDFNHSKVLCASGKPTRHGSIFSGIQLLNAHEEKPAVIVVHDGVRPFIEESLLKEIVIAAKNHGACGVVRPLVSTVLARNSSGFLDYSLDRSKFVASETPQAFQFSVILNAFEKCSQDDIDYGTECLHLALKYSNVPAFLIDGPDYLWKVTYKKDIFAMEGLVKDNLRQFAALVQSNNNSVLSEELKRHFNSKNIKVIDEDELNLDKVNIIIDFSLLLMEDYLEKDVETYLALSRNNILVVLQGGDENKMLKLRKIIDNISRKSSGTSCAVWCENFSNFSSYETIVQFSKMIVNVSMKMTQEFNGQVFSIADRK